MSPSGQNPSSVSGHFDDRPLPCPLCGQLYTPVELQPGDTCKCTRCDAALAKGRASSWFVTFAWVLTGLILWLPANLLPISTVSQLGKFHDSLLITGALELWHEGLPWVAVLVVTCSIIAPLLLLVALAIVLLPLVLGRPLGRMRFLIRWLHQLALWSIPEVYLLAVLVAFIKLDSLAPSEPNAGLWCYSVMSLALLIAWRRFDVDLTAQALATGNMEEPAT